MHAVCGASAGIEREGRVVECRGEAVVRFPGGCTACASCCGTAAGHRQIPLSWLEGAPRHDMVGASAGDVLILGVAPGALTRAAGTVFGVPLAALLLGAWLGRFAADALGMATDAASGVAGLACLVLASIVIARRGEAVLGLLGLTVRRRRMDA